MRLSFTESDSRRGTIDMNSSLELLRILAMTFIVASHCSMHCFLPGGGSKYPINDSFYYWSALGNLGVDLFLLLSGYFLCDKQNPRKNLKKLWVQVLFYSILGTVIWLATGHALEGHMISQALFPATFDTYWFFTAYIIFVLLSPFLNTLIRNLRKEQHLSLIFVMLLFWSVLPSIAGRDTDREIMSQFLLFYLMGSYFKRHPDNLFSRARFRNLTCLICFFLLFLSSTVSYHYGEYLGVFSRPPLFYYSRSSVLAVGCTVSLFAIFAYHKEFHKSIINLLGSCMFGVYLLHDHPLMRVAIWQEWLVKWDYYHTLQYIPYCLFSVALVMAAGILMELIRKALIAEPMLKAADYVISLFLSTSKKLAAPVLKKIH